MTKKAAKKAAAKKKAPATTAATKRAAAKKKAPAKRAAAKKATKGNGKGPYDAKFLDEMRKALLDERATYFHTFEFAKAEADALTEMREPGDVQFDDESGEGDTLAGRA